jgi:hypothetical protein
VVIAGYDWLPVCAALMRFDGVMSSMRIADNLEESTSNFYAELKNCRALFSRQSKEKVFYCSTKY